MQLKKLSLGQSKSTQEIQEYDTGKYALKLDLSNVLFGMYAIDDGQFLVNYNGHYITAIFLDRKLNKVLQLNISNEEKEQLSNILISGYFYEAICRAGVPASILTDNLNILKEFVHKFLQQWNVSLPYEFTLIIPRIEEYSRGTCIRGTWFLQGSSGNYEIGLSIKNDIFLRSGEKTYYLLQPNILKSPQLSNQLSNTKIGAAEKALYWTMLANLHFKVGHGDDIFCLQKDFKGFLKSEEYYEDSDIWYLDDPNEWFKTSNTIRKLLKADNVEDVLLTSKKLKEIYSQKKHYPYA